MANSKDITFVAGINTPDGRGNATVYVGYRELDAIKQDQRDFSACSLGSSGAAPGRSLVRARRRRRQVASSRADSASSTARSAPTTGCGTCLLRISSTSRRTTTISVPTSARRPACSRTTTSARRPASTPSSCSWTTARSRRSQRAAPSSARVPGQPPFFGDQLINCDNPFLTPDQLAAWCGGNPTAGDIFLTIGRRNVEGGGRIDDLRHTSFRGVIGMRGDIADGWNVRHLWLVRDVDPVGELSERHVAPARRQGAERRRRYAPRTRRHWVRPFAA